MVDVAGLLAKVRKEKPLIHHITNWVTIYDCAAVTRAIGALPIMAHAEEEAAEMASTANALVLNIGTPNPQQVRAMVLAGKAANKKGIPVILDPVGAGATKYRTETAQDLISRLKIAVIKGNKSEIGTLAGVKAKTKGVEAISMEGEPALVAKRFAKSSGCVVVVTGKRDIIASPKGTVYEVNGLCDLMGKTVGTGCMSASMIGAFCAVEADPAKAATAALACFKAAGVISCRRVVAPMAFKSALIDKIYQLNGEEFEGLVDIGEA